MSKKLRMVQDMGAPSLKVFEHVKKIGALPLIDINDYEAVRTRILEYFQICEVYECKPTVANLALSLHITRNQLMSWKDGRGSVIISPLIADELSQAYAMINGLMESYMVEGNVNPLSGMFLMKNNHGYKDETEQIVTSKRIEDNSADLDKLEAKYMAAIPVSGEFVEPPAALPMTPSREPEPIETNGRTEETAAGAAADSDA